MQHKPSNLAQREEGTEKPDCSLNLKGQAKVVVSTLLSEESPRNFLHKHMMDCKQQTNISGESLHINYLPLELIAKL
jgi:hypothetical protein